MNKIKFKVNSSDEKKIIVTTTALILAIIFDGKKNKKKHKNIFQRTKKYSKIIDSIMLHTVAKDVKNKKSELLNEIENSKYKTKLRNLEIEQAEMIDLGDI